jgi:hypothetical protein
VIRSRPLPLLAAALLALGALAGPAAAQTTGTAPATTTAPAAGTTTEITAEQAGPGILLDAGDRVELASSLADATEDSGVCFGYVVSLGGTGATDRSETLSNAGPDRAPNVADCPKGSLILQARITYTSASSESDDSASFSVVSDVPGVSSSVATQRLKDLSGVKDGDLVGNDDDLALRNATAALPLTLDGATPAELPASTGTAPNGDHLTGSPGSDWIRAHGLGIAIGVLFLVLAVGLILGGLRGRRRTGDPRRRRRGPRTPSSGAGPDAPSTTTT